MSTEPLERISNPPETRVDRETSPFERRLSLILGIVGLLFFAGFLGYQLYKYFTG